VANPDQGHRLNDALEPRAMHQRHGSGSLIVIGWLTLQVKYNLHSAGLRCPIGGLSGLTKGV
jgi:hypothetical protein